MAAPNDYFLKSANFKSTAIAGLSNYSIDEDGSAKDVATDGSQTITMTYVDNIGMTVSIESTDAGLASGANFRVGAAGILILVMQKRAEGKGAVSPAVEKTATFAHAVLTSVGAGLPHEGDSTLRLTFRCADPDGESAVEWT